MGHVAHHAATGRLPRVSGRAAQHTGVAAQAWLVGSCRPMTLRAVPFLGRAKFHVPRAGPFAPARNYRTTGGWCLIAKKNLLLGLKPNRSSASRAESCRPMERQSKHGPLVPMALRAVSYLGQTKFYVPRADPFGPARNYRTTGGWCPS
jgi:hypothetical protein